MKRIEATVQSSRAGVVAAAINGMVGGLTITEGNGRGSGRRRVIGAGRGTGAVTAEYNKVAVITTIVDDSEVERITSAIAEAAYTGGSGDGIIAVCGVDSVYNIASGRSGSGAL